MKTNHQRGFVARWIKSGPNGNWRLLAGRNYYNSAHHGFERAKRAVKRAVNRLARRVMRQSLSGGGEE